MRWVAVVGWVLVLAGGALAEPVMAGDTEDRQLHAYLFAGTCDAVQSQPIADLGVLTRDHAAGGAMADAAGADPDHTYGAETHVVPTVDALRDTAHVVAVRERLPDREPIIACGAIAGDGDVVEVTLTSFGDTGLEGHARIETLTRVETTTRVETGIWDVDPDAGPARRMQQAPELELTLLDGEAVKLADYRGKTVVIVMWASWCEYCDAEFPMYEEMWQEMRDDDVVFLGIGLKNDDQDKAEAFVEKHGVTFPVGRDTEGGDRVRGRIEQTLGVPGTPAVFIITPDGQVYGAQFGVIERGSFEDAIADAATYRDE